MTMRRFVRRLRGIRGDFKAGEDSQRATDLFDTWTARWPLARPLGYELRYSYADRWVRFHTMANHERVAETEAESAEILHRYRTVLDGLRAGTPIESVVVIATDWGLNDVAGGWTRGNLPGAWPWRSSTAWNLVGDDPEDGVQFFWVTSGLDDDALEKLLQLVADDRATFVLTNASLDWVLHPYDGGMDVLCATPSERDVVRARHAEWLSPYPGGL